ncbi:MerR family transcriptional regulator [Kocuria marina]|uniref:MerR family transcriptional regulator n=1 Tax=Kocuria marina TaxID=223184 RepID=UPI0037F3A8FB
MKISEVAERSGMPASTLRYYECLGILAAHRSPNGYRDFDEGHLERLDFIASAKRLGLELPEIRQLLELADTGTCTGVKAALQPLLAEQIAAVERQLRILTELQEQLNAAQAHVEACPDSDERCRSECAFRAFAGTATGLDQE